MCITEVHTLQPICGIHTIVFQPLFVGVGKGIKDDENKDIKTHIVMLESQHLLNYRKP
jgi:hypothetical protein